MDGSTMKPNTARRERISSYSPTERTELLVAAQVHDSAGGSGQLGTDSGDPARRRAALRAGGVRACRAVPPREAHPSRPAPAEASPDVIQPDLARTRSGTSGRAATPRCPRRRCSSPVSRRMSGCDPVVLIGCSATKLLSAAPARDLYTGRVFRNP